jgi:oligopeptide/dipeptide ABC transporter ATP-binding protein
MSVYHIVEEPLRVNRLHTRSERLAIVKEMLARVQIGSEHMGRYPHEFSGGQRQRIGLARAMALNPRIIICDEPVSALDVSIQAQIINLFSDLQQALGLSYLFISHDLSVIYHISHRVAVMYLGRVVELAEKHELYAHPLHPYTEALMGSIPLVGPKTDRPRATLEGDLPDVSRAITGCPFHTRCAYAGEVCRRQAPQMNESATASGHFVACHRAAELTLRGFDAAVIREASGHA